MSWLPKNRVLVPVDFSDESMKAIDLGLSLVEDASHLHILHVLPQLSVMEPGVLYGDVTEETRTTHVRAEIVKRLAKDPRLSTAVIEVRVGVSHREICDYAEDTKADLIVIPSHGRTGAAALLLGSTAERVVHHAHCPVLVLKKGAK